MRMFAVVLLTAVASLAQTSSVTADPAPSPKGVDTSHIVIPTGTKVPVVLKHAISTKSAREGDPVYAETNFPVVLNEHIVIPAGTYVQGRITHVQRAGRIKGRAEMLMHFTTLIYPSGYTVMLPGSLENVPGAEKTRMKDKEGTIQQDGQKGSDAGKVATAGIEGAQGGALIGAVASRSTGGTLAGAGAGAALGAAIAVFARGADVRLESGTTVEMVIQRDLTIDPGRLPSAVK